ncbi:methyltransferase domain-containing protein 17 [Elsinoe australis]|uniref:Methyltransferase domain-containing protein 17 n=1 Tax=Elsinoe australis TaxID=40998 RepID=A0A4U7B3G3_9PEZI|nr:methyltransferase domain-containing protein 17 [Elsinoe australis]
MANSSNEVHVGSRDKSSSWYTKTDPNVSETTREVLEKYSNIPAADVVAHCHRIRDLAWEIYPYPCIGTFRFLDLSISLLPVYSEMVQRLRTGEQTFLDLGTCFGQDIRRLVYDGVPSEKTYGSDLKLDFMQLGYEMFLDKETLKTTFVAGDVFDAESDLKQLHGQIDILQASAFFHLFDREKQKKVAHRVVKLLKPREGSLLVGRQVGSVKPGEYSHRTNSEMMFRHDPSSWTQMWDEIGQETGSKWDVQAELHEVVGAGNPRALPTAEQQQLYEDVRWIVFSVRRLS